MCLLLKQIRQSKGLTQKQLGDLIGRSKQTVSNLEKGNIKGKVSTWDKLEQVLGIPQQKLRAEGDISAPSGPSGRSARP
jgi:transcriptional regulator with XRE-family HTH domain